MKRMGLPVRTKGAYSSPMSRRACGDVVPTTTRSGLRNSGLETTSTSTSVTRAMAWCTCSVVPTGTVLLSTTTV